MDMDDPAAAMDAMMPPHAASYPGSLPPGYPEGGYYSYFPGYAFQAPPGHLVAAEGEEGDEDGDEAGHAAAQAAAAHAYYQQMYPGYYPPPPAAEDEDEKGVEEEEGAGEEETKRSGWLW